MTCELDLHLSAVRSTTRCANGDSAFIASCDMELSSFALVQGGSHQPQFAIAQEVAEGLADKQAPHRPPAVHGGDA